MNETVKKYKQKFPPGTRVELKHLNDPFATIPVGTQGTVRFVDDIGNIHVNWDDGSCLALVPGVDYFCRVEEPTIRERALVPFGDECEIQIPTDPVNCSKLGFFDEVEDDCWNLIKGYCALLGINFVSNDPDEENEGVNWELVKKVQGVILDEFQELGVQLDFGNDQSDGEENNPVLGM